MQEYYRRHPEAEGRIQSHFTRVLESDDPGVINRLAAGAPFDQIELPAERFPETWVGDEEDREVVEYLRHNDFTLGRRSEFVSQKLASLQGSVEKVSCPQCRVGRLQVSSDDWDEFTADNAITWYWPDWHSVDADGTLHVKATEWRGDCHWTGERAINPGESDYDFWHWVVAQKVYHRLVEESELPAIREEWFRRTRGCT